MSSSPAVLTSASSADLLSEYEISEHPEAPPPRDKRNVCWRVMFVFFPFNARVANAVPSRKAVRVLSTAFALGLLAVVAYTVGGSRCDSTLATRVSNPRIGCISKDLSDARSELYPPTVNASARTLIMYFSLYAPLAISDRIPTFCSTYGASSCSVNVTTTATTHVVEHSGAIGTKEYPVFLSRSAYDQSVSVLCCSDQWTLLNLTSMNSQRVQAANHYALISSNVTVAIDLDPVQADGLWWTTIEQPKPEVVLSWRLSGTTTAFARRLDSQDSNSLLITNTFVDTIQTSQTGDSVGSGVLQSAPLRVPSARIQWSDGQGGFPALLEDGAPSWFTNVPVVEMYTEVDAADDALFHVPFKEGNGVETLCQADACDSVLDRFATAMSLLFGFLGLLAFIVRMMPDCHISRLRGVHEPRCSDMFVPLSAVGLGKRPRTFVPVVLGTVQLLIVGACMYIIVTGGSCTRTFGTVDKGSRAGCVSRTLSTPEKTALFGAAATNAGGSRSLRVTASDGDAPEGFLSSCPGAVAADSTAGVVMEYPVRVENPRFGATFCLVAPATATVDVENFAGDSVDKGVRFGWNEPFSGARRVWGSKRLRHVDKNLITRVCATDLIIYIEVVEAQRTRAFLLLRSAFPFKDSFITLDADILAQIWQDDITSNPESVFVEVDGLELRGMRGISYETRGLVPLGGSSGRTLFLARLTLTMVDSNTRVGCCSYSPVSPVGLAISVDVDLADVIAKGNEISELAIYLQDIETIRIVLNESQAECAGVQAQFDRSARIPLQCEREECRSWLWEIANISAVGFAVLTLCGLLFRACPCCYETETRYDGVDDGYMTFLTVFPREGTPEGRRPRKPVAVLVVLVQVIIIALACMLAVSIDDCRSTYGLDGDVERLGCAQRPLTDTELSEVLSGREVTPRRAVDVADVVYKSMEASSALQLLTVQWNALVPQSTRATLVQSLCAGSDPSAVAMNLTISSSGVGTVTLGNGLAQVAFQDVNALSLGAGTTGTDIVSECVWTGGARGVFAGEQGASVVLLSPHDRLNITTATMEVRAVEEAFWSMVSTNQTQKTLSFTSTGFSMSAPFDTLFNSDDDTYTLETPSVFDPKAQLSSDNSKAVGGKVNAFTIVFQTRLNISTVLASAQSVRLSLDRTLNVAIPVRKGDFELLCVVRKCTPVLDRLSTFLIVALSVTSVLVRMAKFCSPLHEDLVVSVEGVQMEKLPALSSLTALNNDNDDNDSIHKNKNAV